MDSGNEPELYREHNFFFLSKKPRAGKSAMHNLYLTNMQLSLSIKYSATLGFAYTRLEYLGEGKPSPKGCDFS